MNQLCKICKSPTTKDNKGNIQNICEKCHERFKNNNEDYLATQPKKINHICGIPQYPKVLTV